MLQRGGGAVPGGLWSSCTHTMPRAAAAAAAAAAAGAEAVQLDYGMQVSGCECVMASCGQPS